MFIILRQHKINITHLHIYHKSIYKENFFFSSYQHMDIQYTYIYVSDIRFFILLQY